MAFDLSAFFGSDDTLYHLTQNNRLNQIATDIQAVTKAHLDTRSKESISILCIAAK